MDQVTPSPPFSLNRAGAVSVLRHTFLPLVAQGIIETLQSLNLTNLSPVWYVIASAGTQGAIQFLNKFLRTHKSVV